MADLRERFDKTMHYQPVDRIPLMDFGFWDETIEAWADQGLPADLAAGGGGARWDLTRYFGMDGGFDAVGPVTMLPIMEVETVEEDDTYRIYRDSNGTLTKSSKTSVSIPLYLDWLLKDRASWEKHFKWRFDPTGPERKKLIDEAIAAGRAHTGPDMLALNIGSYYGWIRNYMGVENVSLLVYDDPGLFGEMVETIADCIYEVCKRILEAGVRFDLAAGWEDMCYNAGPLLSPTHFKQYLVRPYRRICDLCRQHGIDVIWVDCDGKIDELLPLWFDAGVNCMMPLEIGTWGADPIAFRKQYGKDLLLAGGFDKHILAQGPAEIDAEIIRLTPLVEEGGFIPFCDHRVPPDVSLANHLHYVRQAKEVWGKNIDVGPTPVIA